MMQFLVFQLGKDWYGVDTHRVIRVLPLLECKSLPHAPEYVAGLMNLHGDSIPVLDLSLLAGHGPSAERYDTRIVLADYRARDGRKHVLGLIVEHARRITRIDPRQLKDSGVSATEAPYLGKVAMDDGSILQLVEIDQLLTEAAHEALFPSRENQ
jgi:chemotaxis-related protein WspB